MLLSRMIHLNALSPGLSFNSIKLQIRFLLRDRVIIIKFENMLCSSEFSWLICTDEREMVLRELTAVLLKYLVFLSAAHGAIRQPIADGQRLINMEYLVDRLCISRGSLLILHS